MENKVHIAQSDLTDSYTPDQVFAGEQDIVSAVERLSSGAAYEQYAVLGRVTATNELKVADLAANDGSEVPVAILPYAVDATAGDVDFSVWKGGAFNVDALKFHASFNTPALKLGAFNAGNHNITLRKLRYSM